MSIHTVLIANRGEIAVRIARGCADYGVRSVAVYADADMDALHVRMANAAYSLNGTQPRDTYLNIDKLLAAAHRAGADAVHPGYGFLSENAAFAQAVIDAGLTWIGPAPAVIAQLGDKVQARRIALQVGAPLIAATPEPVKGIEEVRAFVREHGLPVVIKAAYGGGGRGMKVVRTEDEIDELYTAAVREAQIAFGRGECFVERFLDRPRHVEVQVMGDTHGHVVVLGTRDCSLQRRNQKLVEEAPAPFLSDARRQQLHQAAHDICAAVGYHSAGTVEFLLGDNDTISFLEVNTRLQVEHPITEETTGLDLVVEQLRVADGLPLSFTQTPTPRGHAFEFRLNAEDVGRGFLPTPGPVHVFDTPAGPGVRVDAGVAAGSTVPALFDSLMAKLIVTGATRNEALRRARRALAEFRIEGVASVLPLHRAVVTHPDFASDTDLHVHTRWIETDWENTIPAAARVQPPTDDALQRLPIDIDGRRIMLGLAPALLRALSACGVSSTNATDPADMQMPAAETTNPAHVLAPVSGVLQTWQVKPGETVSEGQSIAVMQANPRSRPPRGYRRGFGRRGDGVCGGGGTGAHRIRAKRWMFIGVRRLPL